jgi:hypothetical protein
MKFHRMVLLAPMVALPLAGCATVRRSEARDAEQLLAAAGFQPRSADTPERLANLKTMPPRKLVSHVKDDHFVYSYADPDYCRCLYVGGPKEYSAYERLSVEEEIVQDRLEGAMEWDMWGPWWW